MLLQNRQIETAAVLGHGQMNMILMDVRPFKRQCLSLAQAREKDEFIEDTVDRVVKPVDGFPPFGQVLDDLSPWLFLKPLDRERRCLGQLVCSPSVVPNCPKVFQRMIGGRGCVPH